MKIVFMGTPEFAVPSLNALYKNGHDVLAVVTQPDRPKGRGKKLQISEVKEYALQKSIKVLQPKRIREKEYVELLKALDPDLFVTCAFGQILSKEVLDIPKYGCVNVHGSLLPKYRGAAPIHWAIINGEKKTGITTMLTDVGLDTGDMLLKEEITIDDDMTAGQLHDQMAELGANVLIKTIEELEKGTLKPEKQNNDETCYAPLIKKDTGLINWESTAKDIKNLVRGTNPWPCAYTFYKSKRFRVTEVQVVNESYSGKKYGEIIKADKNGLLINTKEKLILIKCIQFDNKKQMTVEQCICGYCFDEGVILGE